MFTGLCPAPSSSLSCKSRGHVTIEQQISDSCSQTENGEPAEDNEDERGNVKEGTE